MDPLDLVNLTALMERTGESQEIRVGLSERPVLIDHLRSLYYLRRGARQCPGCRSRKFRPALSCLHLERCLAILFLL